MRNNKTSLESRVDEKIEILKKQKIKKLKSLESSLDNKIKGYGNYIKDAIEEKVQEQIEPEPVLADEKPDVPQDQVELETKKKRGFFSRLMQGLSKTSSAICAPVMDLLHGKKKLDEDALEELETILLQADMGVELSEHLIASMVEASKRADLENRDYLFEHLKNIIIN